MKELEDSRYFPACLRDYQTGLIGFVVVRLGTYRPFIDYLRSLGLPKLPLSDQCSGSGEPAVHIFEQSGCFSRLTLNDKFPHRARRYGEGVSYTPYSVDVLRLQFRANTCYTLLNAFHHFSRQDQVRILQRLQASGATVFIAEVLEPTLTCFLKVLFATTFGTLLLTPFVRPFSIGRIFFTYILPINVFTIAYDGIVSVLKSSTLAEYRNLSGHLGDSFRAVKLRKGLSSLIILQILPK